MAATGLSADPTEYRARLADQSDDQIDAWVAELMRDVVDPSRHRQGRRRLPPGDPARRAWIRTGVRFGGGPPAWSGATPRAG